MKGEGRRKRNSDGIKGKVDIKKRIKQTKDKGERMIT